MAKDFFSSEVCELLARELVTEQAELLKHEVLVKEIKAKLIEGKKQLIKKLIVGETFLIDGKKRTALDVAFEDNNEGIWVSFIFGLYPSEIIKPQDLTEKEKELLKEYCDYLLDFKDVLADWAGRDAIDCARKLWIHEHEMYLTTVEDFDIDLSNATTPGFFEQTGLMVYERDKCCMLEDLMVC